MFDHFWCLIYLYKADREVERVLMGLRAQGHIVVDRFYQTFILFLINKFAYVKIVLTQFSLLRCHV